MTSLILPPTNRDNAIAKAIRFFHALPEGKAWSIAVEQVSNRRSEQQNKYLWAVCYPTILAEGGETLGGWTKDDLHEFFLGEWSGWNVLEGFGRKRMKPMRRSSRMNKQDFADYVAFIQRKAAEMGIFIPDPDPEWFNK